MNDNQPQNNTTSLERSEEGRALERVEEPLKSVFSTVAVIKVGTGTTARKQETRLLWYVEQKTAEEYAVRKINPSFVPVGEESIISREELLCDYSPEVEIHNSQVQPAIIELKKTISRGDRHREDGQLLSAEMEYNHALDVDETNVRATFGLGLVYLERQDTEKARMVFEELVGMQAAFTKKHKHLFNEFGISLRKSELYDEAVRYYERAVELTDTDENLFYNLARAHFEKGNWDQCVENAGKALDIDSMHEYALALCRFVVTLSASDSKREKLGMPPVTSQALEQARKLAGEQSTGSGTGTKAPARDLNELEFKGI